MFCVLLFRLPAVYPVHSFADRIRTLGICLRTHDSSTILKRKFDILHFSITAPRILGEGRAKLWKLALEAPPCISPLGRFRKCWQVCISIKAIYVCISFRSAGHNLCNVVPTPMTQRAQSGDPVRPHALVPVPWGVAGQDLRVRCPGCRPAASHANLFVGEKPCKCRI